MSVVSRRDPNIIPSVSRSIASDAAPTPQDEGRVRINPAPAVLGRANAVLTGTARRHHVPEFEGSLSIKAVITGCAVWQIGARRFSVRDDCLLILNDRQRYTMSIDSRQKTTTFCLFFERGFVEDIWRVNATSSRRLLDTFPFVDENRGPGFFERLEPAPRFGKIHNFYRAVCAGTVSTASFAASFVSIAEELVWRQRAVLRDAARLSAVRASTRMELYRRVNRARDLLLSSWNRPLRLKEIARAACLSPYHLHRSFAQCFGETPHRMLTNYRLQRVAEELTRTQRSVTELCYEAGFESLPSFSALFRRRHGMSPREYRRVKGRTLEIRKIR